MGVVSSARRPAPYPVIERLVAAPGGYELFQTLALIEAATPDAAPFGETTEADREAARLSGQIGQAFPGADVSRISLQDRPTVDVEALSLAGGFGPLPPPYAERLRESNMRGDRAMRDFLDMFNHRLIALMMRAHRRSRVTPEYADGRRASPLEEPLRALIGLAEPSTQIALGALPAPAGVGLTPFSLFPHAPTLSRPIASQDGFERVLAEHFRAPVRVEPLQGRRRALDKRDMTRLGRSGLNAALGRETVAGRFVWDPAAALNVILGPLNWSRFLDFLPGRPGAEALRALSAAYLGQDATLSLKLKLAAGEARPSRLPPRSSRLPEAQPTTAPLLGRTSWIGKPLRPAEAVLRLEATAAATPEANTPNALDHGGHRPGTVKALQAVIAAHFP